MQSVPPLSENPRCPRCESRVASEDERGLFLLSGRDTIGRVVITEGRYMEISEKYRHSDISYVEALLIHNVARKRLKSQTARFLLPCSFSERTSVWKMLKDQHYSVVNSRPLSIPSSRPRYVSYIDRTTSSRRVLGNSPVKDFLIVNSAPG